MDSTIIHFVCEFKRFPALHETRVRGVREKEMVVVVVAGARRENLGQILEHADPLLQEH